MVHRSHLKHSISSAALLGGAIVFLLSGCAGVAKGAALQPTPTASTTPTAVGNAQLIPQPGGSANLTWDPSNDNTLIVTLSATGLAPMSPDNYPSAAYPATIGSGSCQQQGKVEHQLDAITADQYGAATATTTIKGVAGGIPTRGWYIAIHSPAAANQGSLLACANILNPKPSTSEKQSVKAWLHSMPQQQGSEGAYGKARLSLSGTTLTVTLFIDGLAPGSQHAAHIHAGSCAKQGPVVHPLKNVVADASGRAQIVTTIDGVKSLPGNWYVNIHNGIDLTTQAGFEPIACGDVFTRS